MFMIKHKVYLIRRKSDDKVLYVGCTHQFKRRRKEHFKLKTNTAYWLREIGVDNVYMECIESFRDRNEALKYEDYMILFYNTIEDGYNVNRSGGKEDRKNIDEHLVEETTPKFNEELINYRNNILRVLNKLDNCESIIRQYKEQGFDIYSDDYSDDVKNTYERVFHLS